MKISSNLQNDILAAHRAGAKVERIAITFGFPQSEIEKIIYPHGKQPRALPVVIHRKRPDQPKQEKEVEVNVDEQKKKWSDAGRKAWITRMQNKLKQQPDRELPPPAQDQPIAILTTQHLVTITQEDRETAIQQLTEAVEYLQVGLDNVKKALELLKK